MHRWVNSIIVSATGMVIAVCRLPGLRGARVYTLWGHPAIQPLLDHLSRRRALDVALRARRRCPAYRAFLEASGTDSPRHPRDFSSLPQTTKQNYIKAFSIEDRCVDGRLPMRGVVIDESSGSSGAPNNWVRGRAERASTRRLLHHAFDLTFAGEPVILLNCFALGPWATGMNVSMSLADATVLKSIGPDRSKVEATLRTLGPRYPYVIAGYPPFIKDLLDSVEIDLAPFRLHLIVGGEGISEGLRDHFLRVFASVRSSYGASDIEINIASETDRTIAIRRLVAERPELCRTLFGRDDPPMIFQYNPFDYHIEQSPEGELVFTVLRPGDAAPKIRYNIRDAGGSISYRAVIAALRAHAVDPGSLPPGPALPVLFVYGRTDLTLPFYGAKVFAADFDAVLGADQGLRAAFHSFQANTIHDESLSEIMTIALERTRGRPAGGVDDPAELARAFRDGLMRVNQDFREVARMFGAERIRVEVHDFGTGPFADRDIRTKSRYIATAEAPHPPE